MAHVKLVLVWNSATLSFFSFPCCCDSMFLVCLPVSHSFRTCFGMYGSLRAMLLTLSRHSLALWLGDLDPTLPRTCYAGLEHCRVPIEVSFCSRARAGQQVDLSSDWHRCLPWKSAPQRGQDRSAKVVARQAHCLEIAVPWQVNSFLLYAAVTAYLVCLRQF